MSTTVVVTGGRGYDDHCMVDDVLELLSPVLVLVGDCPTGADLFTREWCRENDVECVVFKAYWGKYGKSAGPKRNTTMLIASPSDSLVVAFPGGKGTEDCVRQAGRMNRVVFRLEP